MKNEQAKHWFPSLLAFLMVVTTSLPFLTVYELDDYQFLLIVSLAFFCLVTHLFRQGVFLEGSYIIIYLATLYFAFPLNQSFGFQWFARYLQEISFFLANFRQQQVNFFPETVAFPFFLLLLITCLFLLIRYNIWRICYVFLCSYLLMLAIFNEINLGIHVVFLTFLMFCFFTWQSQQTNKSTKERQILLPILILTILMANSYYFPRFFPQVRNVIVTNTFPLRNYLNTLGIYQELSFKKNNGLSTTGFSIDDTSLGGPIKDDRTPIFKVTQTNKSYWRVETKSYYTGKGWKNTPSNNTATTEQLLTILTTEDYKGTFTPESTISFTFLQPFPYLPHPYGKVTSNFFVNAQTDNFEEQLAINLLEAESSREFTWQQPLFTSEELNTVPYQAVQNSLNTQIPATLPKRVSELADTLTKDKQTLYEKVHAIEVYLKESSNFYYSKIDAPYTPEEADYIDYFLFESKIGYCNNFSSAMVVLLRSLGIESRWAKGFSYGELMTTNNKGEKEYTIRNSDAHSWPEVYFSGFGWVPFEPTPGFVAMYQLTEADNQSLTETSTSDSVKQSEQNTSSETIEATKKNSETTGNQARKKAGEIKSFLQKYQSLIPYFLLTVFLFLLLFFGFKRYFFFIQILLYQKLIPFEKSYLLLLKKANALLPRSDIESLLLYAKRLEKTYPLLNNCFVPLTKQYEALIYGPKKQNNPDYSPLIMQTAKLLLKLSKT